jgi:hypothetical protein
MGNPMYGKPAPKGSGIGWKGWYKGWFFRSLKELSYMINVIERGNHKWKSAESQDLSVRFINWEGHERTYRADFLIDDIELVEVKPKKLMNTPTNQAKRDAAIAFCATRGYRYVVEDAPIMTNDEITRLWQTKMIVFTKQYEKMFRKRYAA